MSYLFSEKMGICWSDGCFAVEHYLSLDTVAIGFTSRINEEGVNYKWGHHFYFYFVDSAFCSPVSVFSN